jgi:magnesium-transporting ATPase (P-type)
MSPSKTSPGKTRPQFVPARPRAEVFTAIAVGAAIVLGTLALIWLMRPGPQGIPGKGGLFSRQARFTMLLILTLAALGFMVSFFLRRRHPGRLGTNGSIAAGSAVIVVLAVVAGIFWPGGLIRHWPKQPKIATPDTNPVTTVTPATTAKPGTTVKPGSTTIAPNPSTSPTTKAG